MSCKRQIGGARAFYLQNLLWCEVHEIIHLFCLSFSIVLSHYFDILVNSMTIWSVLKLPKIAWPTPLKLQENIRLERDSHDLCDTGVVLYQLSYQAKWELDFTIYGYITKSLSEQLMIDLQSLFEDILSSCAPRESTTFWPLWWRVLLSKGAQTTLNNIRFVKFLTA